MSRVPMGSARIGQNPYGPSMEARYAPGLVSQGVAAELVAAKYELSRQDMDSYSARSHELAAAARESGAFRREILGISTPNGLVEQDETIRPGTSVEKLGTLQASFRNDELSARFPQIGWNVTAGNASQISDGACAMLLMSESMAQRLGLKPRARFVAFDVCGDDPVMMLTAPIPASQRAIKKSGLKLDQIDHYEINEAFACVRWLAARARRRPGTPEPARRRDCAGPSTGRLWRAADDHHAACTGRQRPALWPAVDVRGRRHGQRHHYRAPVSGASYRTYPIKETQHETDQYVRRRDRRCVRPGPGLRAAPGGTRRRRVIADLSEERGNAAVDEFGGKVRFLKADVTDTDQMNAVYDAAEAIAPLRALIHCAGLGGPVRVVEKDGSPGSLEKYESIVRINLIGTFNALRLGAARMAKNELIDGERGAAC